MDIIIRLKKINFLTISKNSLPFFSDNYVHFFKIKNQILKKTFYFDFFHRIKNLLKTLYDEIKFIFFELERVLLCFSKDLFSYRNAYAFEYLNSIKLIIGYKTTTSGNSLNVIDEPEKIDNIKDFNKKIYQKKSKGKNLQMLVEFKTGDLEIYISYNNKLLEKNREILFYINRKKIY